MFKTMESHDPASQPLSRRNLEAGNDDVDKNKYKSMELMAWEPYGAMTKARYTRRIWKNIIMLSVAFMLIYASQKGLASLQSSLHVQDGMGTICASIRDITMVISCIFVPPLMIRFLGHKYTISLSFISFIIWMVANGYGDWASMVPASIISGFFVAPLWAAQGSYITILAEEYANIEGEEKDNQIAIFFGVSGLIFCSSGIFGNSISSALFTLTQTSENNQTNEFVEGTCGMDYCPWYELEGTNTQEVPKSSVWFLVGIYIAIGISAILISVFFIDNIPQHLIKPSDMTIRQEMSSLVLSTSKQVIKTKQLVLIPITMYMGLQSTFYILEYNRSWVACGLGISMIGTLVISHAVMSSLMSFVSGRLAKITGRIPIFLAAMILDITSLLFLTFWAFDTNESSWFFLFPILWGTTEAIWGTMIWAIYGIFFSTNTEAAFANALFWEFLGSALGSSYSNALCTRTKILILFAALLVGIVCYFLAEFVEKREKRQEKRENESKEMDIMMQTNKDAADAQKENI